MSNSWSVRFAFRYRLASADANNTNADQLGNETDVSAAGLSLVAATFDHKQVIVELEPIEMPSGKPWLTASIRLQGLGGNRSLTASQELNIVYSGTSVNPCVGEADVLRLVVQNNTVPSAQITCFL